MFTFGHQPILTSMEAPNLGIDSEDLTLDIIPAIEKSFGFEFEQADLADVHTYGELCAAVRVKLPGVAATDCTSQQAFYKLRQAMQPHTGAQLITPATRLLDILPINRVQRQASTAAIEHSLGMKLQLLGMPLVAANFGSLLLILSFFISLIGGAMLGAVAVPTGLASIAVAIIIFDLGNRFGTTLQYTTVREVVLLMSSQYYQQSRRDPSTVNSREITDQLNNLSMRMADLKLAELRPDAML